MAEKTRDEIFADTMRPLLRAGETLQCVAYGVKTPPILLIILLMVIGVIPGVIIGQMLTKYFLVALTDQRVIVARAKGIVQTEGHFDYPLGKVGGKVTLKEGWMFTHIAIEHPELPWKAKFHRSGSPNNKASALAIAAALQQG